jgi:fatty acid synthase subunit beta
VAIPARFRPSNYLAPKPKTLPKLVGIEKVEAGNEITYTLGDNLPEPSSWSEKLARPDLTWLRALLTSVTIVQGTSYINNPICRLLTPRRGQKIVVNIRQRLRCRSIVRFSQ